MNKTEYYSLLRLGYLKRVLRERVERSSRTPALRGGNSSAMFGARVIGLNPKEAVLRYLGHEMPPSFDTVLLFDAGYSNEASHSALLKEAGVDFKEEEEIPVSWSVTVLDDNEEPVTFPVTGRPDRGLMIDGKVSYIVEEKQCASSWKAYQLSNFGQASPKPENICQAAHYSHQHGKVPAALVYTSRVWNAAKKPASAFKDPTHRALLGSEDFVFGIKPFMALYELEWNDDGFLYLDGKKTVITFARITEYYEFIAHCVVTKTIPSVHYNDHFGAPMTKSKIEKYFDHKDCDESSWDVWVEAVRLKCEAAWRELEEELAELEGV